MILSSNKKGVQILVAQCVAIGLKHVVVSPGSRNAPLIIAFNQHPEIETVVIPDERSAAFYALGMAQQLKQPVGVLCTSGSAPLNYYPAVAEAYYQQVPLVVLSADRPQAWVNQGDGQTIVQHNVFSGHIRYSVTLPEENTADFDWVISREISTAFHHAMGNVKGPIHINLPFSEPLYGQENVDFEKLEYKSIRVAEGRVLLNNRQRSEIQQIWEKSPKKLIICGQLQPDDVMLESLKKLANDPSVLILVENTSNLVDTRFVHCIDRLLNSIAENQKSEFAPDLLITIGGAVVSKRIKSFLRQFKPTHHWKIGYDFLFMDTYQALTLSIPMYEADFFNTVAEFSSIEGANYWTKWKQLDYLVQDKASHFFETNQEFGDTVVFQTVLDFIPESSHLHMANSSVIRYCQLFDPIKSINYWCNRGTSGIDGSTSTAAGAARITKDTWHTLITGDMSFFYDSNALWNNVLTPNFRIFLINNGGGGIFKIIPGPKSTAELDDFFVFNNQFNAENLCKTFGLTYFKADSVSAIENQMAEFYTYEENGQPKLMEIFTPGDQNDVQLENFFKAVRVH